MRLATDQKVRGSNPLQRGHRPEEFASGLFICFLEKEGKIHHGLLQERALRHRRRSRDWRRRQHLALRRRARRRRQHHHPARAQMCRTAPCSTSTKAGRFPSAAASPSVIAPSFTAARSRTTSSSAWAPIVMNGAKVAHGSIIAVGAVVPGRRGDPARFSRHRRARKSPRQRPPRTAPVDSGKRPALRRPGRKAP